ncbi:MAG: hypothetical protein AUI92_04445 [Thaumarchaeota archaeon 13_1_40CM_3_38_6]|nr:MAG: hypothetical protein AUI92_04445 [Thaumarchaeota archaeon 13_1_40CM_3_38_6]
MRILILVFHFPPISGGGSVVSFDLASTFAELGHDVTVLVPDLEWKGERYEPKINPKINVIRVETPSRSNLKLAARRCYPNLKRKGEELGRKEKFDFVFTIFHPFHLVPYAAVSCGKSLGIPVMVKIDDAVYEKSSGLKVIQRRIEKIYSSKTLNDANILFVSNPDTRDLVSSYYKVPKERIRIIPNGVNLSLFHIHNSERKRIVVFSGMMYYHRGLDILLEASAKVVTKLPDSKFVLLGEGPELVRLRGEVKKKNLTSNVEFKGWVERSFIPSYLASSAIGIGPLRCTNVTKNVLPIKVLEYMASSLPILAVKGTLTNDVLINGYNGYIIENSDELAKKIIELLENEKVRQEMGLKSAEMASRFDWRNIVQTIINEYEKIKNQ